MAGVLSDQAWADICAAAGRHRPRANARAVLSQVLFEEHFPYHRERVFSARKRAARMLKLLDAFAELYRQTYAPHLPVDQFEAILASHASAFITDDLRTERDLSRIQGLRQRAEAVGRTAQALITAHSGGDARSRDVRVQREMLYHRLCTVWLDHFHGTKLAYSRPKRGGKSGKPTGPLIRFILTAMRQIMPEDKLPKAETVSDNIDREIDGHVNLEILKALKKHDEMSKKRRDMGA